MFHMYYGYYLMGHKMSRYDYKKLYVYDILQEIHHWLLYTYIHTYIHYFLVKSAKLILFIGIPYCNNPPLLSIFNMHFFLELISIEPQVKSHTNRNFIGFWTTSREFYLIDLLTNTWFWSIIVIAQSIFCLIVGPYWYLPTPFLWNFAYNFGVLQSGPIFHCSNQSSKSTTQDLLLSLSPCAIHANIFSNSKISNLSSSFHHHHAQAL